MSQAKKEMQTQQTITLGELTWDDVDRSGPLADVEFRYVDIGSVDREKKMIVAPEVLPAAKAPSRAKQRLKAGDVLVSMTRPNLNAVAIVPQSLNGAIGSTGFHVLRAKDADPQFLYYAVRTTEFVQAMSQKVQGALYPAVRPSDISAFCLPAFTVDHQRRIVAKIEELFSELDKGIENLKQARAQLGVYRQSLLKYAFEGHLTADWRAAHVSELETAEQLVARITQERHSRYEKRLKAWEESRSSESLPLGKKPQKPAKPAAVVPPTSNEMEELPELPTGWIWLRVRDVCEVVRGGSPRPAGDPKYYDGNIPFLKVADLTQKAGVYLDTFEYSIKEAGLTKTRLVEPPTLMISNSGATLGVPKICRITATFNDGIAAFLDLPESEQLFHYYFWASKTRALRAIDQGAAQPNLNTSLLENYLIPYCSTAEMVAVAAELEKQLSELNSLERDIDANLQKAEALRQSILKKAFAGELVPQDPNDEPASELLARIRAERAALAPTPKSKKPRKAALA